MNIEWFGGWSICVALLGACVAAAHAGETPRDLLGEGPFDLLRPAPGDAAWTNAAVQDLPSGCGTGFHIEIRKATEPFYWIALGRTVPVAVPAGSRVSLRFWARSATRNPMRAVVEKSTAPWTSVAEVSPVLTPEWREYRATGTPRTEFPAGGLAVRFQMGHQTGRVELAGIRLEDLGPDPGLAAARSAIEPATMQARIAKVRMGDLAIRVTGADGRPVSGAVVRVEQTRHAFLFGCNIFVLRPENTEDWQRAYQDRFTALLNYATLPFYWGFFEPEPGKPEYAKLDAMARWCREHGLTTKGHPLVWHEVYPGWAPRQANEAVPLLRQRVLDIIRHYRDTIRIWDVLNEANNAGDYTPANGETAWVRREGPAPAVQAALGWAREAVGDGAGATTLLYNDFNTGEANRGLLRELEVRRALPDAIGIQSHMHAGTWPLEEVWQTTEEFARFGRPIHFTELTVLSGPFQSAGKGKPPGDWPSTPAGEAQQAEYVEKFYTVLFSHPAVQAITWWDFSDRESWQRAPAGLVRRDMSPKPAYDRLMGLIRKAWWTDVRAETDKGGTCIIRAFHGAHRVTATDPQGRTATVSVELPIGSAGREVAIVLPPAR